MKKVIFSTIVIIVLSLMSESCSNSSNDNRPYQCPMQCEKDKVYDKAGECPECGMDLEQVDSVVGTDSVSINK